jgi:hypothetical protein
MGQNLFPCEIQHQLIGGLSVKVSTILLVVDRISSTHRTPGLVSSLFSGLNQLISRALFDGVWIGKDDLEVRATGGSTRDTTGTRSP